jgi:hypothetical protein
LLAEGHVGVGMAAEVDHGNLVHAQAGLVGFDAGT